MNKFKMFFVYKLLIFFLCFYASNVLCNAACYVLNLKSEQIQFGFKGRDIKNVAPNSFDKIDIGNLRNGLKISVVIDKKEKEIIYAYDEIFLFVVMPELRSGKVSDDVYLFKRTGMRRAHIGFNKDIALISDLKKDSEKIIDFLLANKLLSKRSVVLGSGVFLDEDAALNIIKSLEKSLDNLLVIKDVKLFDKKDKELSNIVKRYEEILSKISEIKNLEVKLENNLEKIVGQDGFGHFKNIIYENESFKNLKSFSASRGFDVLKPLANNSLVVIEKKEKYHSGSKKILAKASEIEKIKNEIDEFKKNIDRLTEYNYKKEKLEKLKVLFDKEIKKSEEKINIDIPVVGKQKDEVTILELVTEFFKSPAANSAIIANKILIYFKRLSIEDKKEEIKILEKELEEFKKNQPEIVVKEYLEKKLELEKLEEEFVFMKQIFIGTQNNLIKDLKFELEKAKKEIL